jgi:hypothetical protein
MAKWVNIPKRDISGHVWVAPGKMEPPKDPEAMRPAWANRDETDTHWSEVAECLICGGGGVVMRKRNQTGKDQES